MAPKQLAALDSSLYSTVIADSLDQITEGTAGELSKPQTII